jgi:hypothetical protein
LPRLAHSSVATTAKKAYEMDKEPNVFRGTETEVGWISRKNLDPPVEAELFS